MKSEVVEKDEIRQAVRARYGQIASDGAASCGGGACCMPATSGESGRADANAASRAIGYGEHELAAAPDGANLGLGCGNPQAIAALRPGEVVLDLGSGAGFDAFLAARAVGSTGKVIGVDMTPAMVSKARGHAAAGNEFAHVEFRLGEIEALPVADASVDVIISNCVINLSPDKPRVFAEAFRVLKPGGRLAVADVVALAAIPEALRADWELYTGCVAGASSVHDIRAMLAAVGFEEIRIARKGESADILEGWFPGRDVSDYVASAAIEAVKPNP